MAGPKLKTVIRTQGNNEALKDGSAEVQKAMAGTSLEARLESFSEAVFQQKFAFGLIEAERAMRRQHRNERARHIPKSIDL